MSQQGLGIIMQTLKKENKFINPILRGALQNEP
jgi:ABC-type enterochelin transport system permease subunit